MIDGSISYDNAILNAFLLAEGINFLEDILLDAFLSEGCKLRECYYSFYIRVVKLEDLQISETSPDISQRLVANLPCQITITEERARTHSDHNAASLLVINDCITMLNKAPGVRFNLNVADILPNGDDLFEGAVQRVHLCTR